jgi:WD40 repeat protein
VKTSSAYAGVAFSPDSQLLALAMGGSSTVKLWALSDGHELHQLIGHTQTVKSIAFSANGTALATTSEDQTVRLWGLPAK